MCDMNLRLVAWIDGELSGDEAAAVEQHVQACADCGQRVATVKSASSDFGAYYFASNQVLLQARPLRRTSHWIPLAVAAAGVIVVTLLLLPGAKKHTPPPPPQAARVTVPVAVEPAALPVVEQSQPTPSAARRRAAPRRQLVHEDWAIGQPAIQIAIPADAMFPPGAVPEGVAYIANVSFAADGSVEGFRLQR
jgi:anti-sigma factor RsiW